MDDVESKIKLVSMIGFQFFLAFYINLLITSSSAMPREPLIRHTSLSPERDSSSLARASLLSKCRVKFTFDLFAVCFDKGP